MAKKSAVDSLDFPLLCENINKSRLALRYPRQSVVDMAREVAGNSYSEDGAEKTVMVNLLSVYQTIVSQNLVPHNPRVMLSTFQRSIKPAVSAMQSWANKQIERIKLHQALQRTVVHGLYSFGIGKVALAMPAEAAAASWSLRAGEATYSNIDQDDWVQDMHARSYESVSYMGHRYRVPFDAVRDSKFYSKMRLKLSPTFDKIFNEDSGDERISMIGRTTLLTDSEEWMPMIDLWEIYLPAHRLVLTFADDQLHGGSSGIKQEPLRVQSWIGPDRGPYHILGYGIVPGNCLPKGPMQDLVPLHRTANNLYRKLARSLENIKELTLIRGGADQDGSTILEANDGEVRMVSDPKNISQIVTRGQHAQLLMAVATEFKNLFDFVGGNLSLMGGRAPQSRTLGQDRLLDANAQAGVADLQERTIDYVSDVCRALCWYWWHDPHKVMKTRESLPGAPGMEITRRLHPAGGKGVLQRNGKFEDLEINVDPYSLQHQTPQQKANELDELIKDIIIPYMPFMQQQGKSLDMDAYLKARAQYRNQPDVMDLINISEMPDQQEQGPPDKPPMAARSQREYTRKNVSEMTPQGHDQQMQASMLGHDLGGNPNKNGTPMGALGRKM